MTRRKKTKHNPWIDMTKIYAMCRRMKTTDGATIRDLMRATGRSMATVYRWLRMLPDLVGRSVVRRRVGRVFRWFLD